MRVMLLCLALTVFSGCCTCVPGPPPEPVGKGAEGMYRIPMYDSEGNRHWLFLPKQDPNDFVTIPWKNYE